jgi:hypothetical protein
MKIKTRGKNTTSKLFEYTIERNPDEFSDIWYQGQVTTKDGNVYTFAIGNVRRAKQRGGKVRDAIERGERRGPEDDTGFSSDRACQWSIEFGQSGLPMVFCRSDHKMAKRIICAIILAFENGQKHG